MKLRNVLNVADLRLSEAGSAEDVPNETLLRNARSFKPGTVPVLSLQATVNPSRNPLQPQVQPNQANKVQFRILLQLI